MSWQSALMCWVLRHKMRPETAKPGINVARARALTAKRAWSPKVPAGWHLEQRYGANDAPLRGEWLSPANKSGITMLYLHGGGYYFCSPATHRGIVFPLARRSGARVFSLDYRLAPEHPFPAALDDALAAYRWLIADGVSPESLVIAGDSAGGGLALATLLALRDTGDPLPAGAVLFSPWTDLAATGASIVTNDGLDPMFHGRVFAPAGKLYQGSADVRNPYVSPLYGHFDGLPPLFIQVGDTEVLFDDSTRVIEKARAAGVSVEADICPKMPHVFQMFAPFVPESNQALERAAAFVRRVVSARQPETADAA
jgi:monoterpene epsilon-lactone hydrolase